jgi:hypothetical protein
MRGRYGRGRRGDPLVAGVSCGGGASPCPCGDGAEIFAAPRHGLRRAPGGGRAPPQSQACARAPCRPGSRQLRGTLRSLVSPFLRAAAPAMLATHTRILDNDCLRSASLSSTTHPSTRTSWRAASHTYRVRNWCCSKKSQAWGHTGGNQFVVSFSEIWPRLGNQA